MKPVGIVLDPRFMDHVMEPGHVESPRRIEALLPLLDEAFLFPILRIPPRPASVAEIERIHDRAYVRSVAATEGREFTRLDPDTAASARTYATARLAAGGTIEAADAVADGRAAGAFALVRPPGHHAEADRAKGFCVFNNVAIAAEHLVRERGFRRVLIADWDLHHGNGTEHAFSSRRDVLFFSTHQVPLYPGTGRATEAGDGEGRGFTVNVPLLAGHGDDDFLSIYATVFSPIAAVYRPDFVLVSAGYDIAAGDPLGGMRVTAAGFRRMAASLVRIAAEHAGGRVLFVLEGGYDLTALRDGVRETLMAMGPAGPDDARAAAPISPSPALAAELAPTLEVLREFWPV